MSGGTEVDNPADAPRVFDVDGTRVMLDADVARAFGTETKRINEAVTRNPEKFQDAHTFKLTRAQAAALRSQAATSQTKGRGGSRYAPRVFTLHGIARLATILNTPEALRATDLIINTFLQVQEQIARGRKTVAIANPDEFAASRDDRQERTKLRRRMHRALNGLLDSLDALEKKVDAKTKAKALGGTAFDAVVERLRTQGLKNVKLEADTALVLAQAQKVRAEARKAEAEAEGVDLDNLDRKIALVRQVIEVSRDLEPVAFVEALEVFDDAEPLKLEAPTPPKSSRAPRKLTED